MSTQVQISIQMSQAGHALQQISDALEHLGWRLLSATTSSFVRKLRLKDVKCIKDAVRKEVDFAAFSAGLTGRFPFVLKIGKGNMQITAVRVGTAGKETNAVKAGSVA